VRAPAASDTRSIDKPPLIARGASDRAWMERWLNAELNAMLDIADRNLASEAAAWLTAFQTDADVILPSGDRASSFRQLQRQRHAEVRARLKSDAPVIEAAKRGDLGPAREKYPELFEAGMLRLPPQSGRGKRFPKDNGLTPYQTDLTEAVWDAAKMRDIWKREYTSRPKGYDSPEAMAARRYRVNEEHVHTWAKDRRCPKRPAAEPEN
jgi:hypothetical protein